MGYHKVMPAPLNLTVKQGDTFTLTVNLTDSLGNPRDVSSGYLYDSQIRKAGATRLSPAGGLYGEFDVDYTDANVGVIRFVLYPDESRGIPSGIAWYDVQEIDENTSPDTVLTLLEGKFTVVPDVTLVEPAS
jgi:hypothetical protein